MIRLLFKTLIILLTFFALLAPAQGEYGDVILNKRAEKNGQRPVVFPHWFHRIRFQCKVCHSELGFTMRATENDVLMSEIMNGKSCGMCHDGKVAWGVEQCDLCHSGMPGLASQIMGGERTMGPGRW